MEPPWPPGMIRCATTSLRSPAPWRPRSSSASPVASGLASRCAASARALALRARRPRLTGPHCASVHGFSLHANTQIPAHRRDQLERLIRYTARGAVSLERLQEDANGDLVYTFTHPWSDGTTGIRLSPLELLEKLAALGPPAAHPPGALWGLSGATQPSAPRDHPDPAPARGGRGGDADGSPRIGPGPAAEARVCPGDGTLPVLSARGAAAHRRHHAGRSDPQDPPPSETLCRPTPHRACPFPPSTM